MKIQKTTLPKDKLRQRLIRSSITGVIFFILVITGFLMIRKGPKEDASPVVLRNNFKWNEKIGRFLYSNNNLAPEMPMPPPGKKPRVNGLIGLKSPIDEKYRIQVSSGEKEISLSVAEIRALPKSYAVIDFKCIEGWSEVFQYAGLSFNDFLNHFQVGKKPDGTYYKFVGFQTPDEEYYVSIDIESMLHPQTILAYEMNSAELAPNNGFPLRLMIPNKYGIKNLKRIGSIYFSDEQPPDYWAEQGYDWYAGL
ncbi:MAG: molybdopterin-dependent oxidoreductase [Bdellovibrionota bacterium]